MLHHRGLMHFDEDDTAAGGLNRNTKIQEANAKPEVIRRTPTKFITVKRRIIKFNRDFISHNESDSVSTSN